jgi:hypothetical protein
VAHLTPRMTQSIPEADTVRLPNGMPGQYWVVGSLGGRDVVVRLKAEAPPPNGYVHDEYEEEFVWYWTEEVLNPDWGVIRCRDDKLKQQLNEMEVLAWVSQR